MSSSHPCPRTWRRCGGSWTDPPGGRGRGETGSVRSVLSLAGAVVLTLVVVFAVAWYQNRPPEQPGPAGSSSERAAVEAVGPIAGNDLASYKAQREAELKSASGSRLAVVSLTKYSTEAEARGAAGAGGKVEVLGLLAALPGGPPSFLTGDLSGWVNKQKQEAAVERSELQRQLQTTDNAEFASQFRADIDRLGKLISGARADRPHIFGVVVRAPADVLKALARDPRVRLVDVGPSEKAAPEVRFTGVRPEETVKAGQPPERPL